jgi:hypothetical protein
MNLTDCYGKSTLDLLLRDVAMPSDHISYGCLACFMQVSSDGADGREEVVESSRRCLPKRDVVADSPADERVIKSSSLEWCTPMLFYTLDEVVHLP